MNQAELADGLRRGGVALIAQQVADLMLCVLPEELVAEHLANCQARAAAVPAGNQASVERIAMAERLSELEEEQAPTALDEMRALQEGIRCEPAECDKVQSRLIRELTESREALARVEAERDELRRKLEGSGKP